MDIMLKVLKSNFEEEIMEEINSSFIKIDKNKESISNLSRKNDKIYSDLSLTKAELLKYLTIKLDNLKSKHFLTLSEFLYPEKTYNEMNGKNIRDDFIFLFYDSLNKIHVLYPDDISALFIYKQVKKVDANNFRNFTEDNIRKDIEKVWNTTKRFNWISSLEKSDSLRILRKDGILIIPTFIYLSNGRKTHSKMKINNCFIFRRTPETKKLFEMRDLILKILQSN